MEEKVTQSCSCPECEDCTCCGDASYPGNEEFKRQMWKAAEQLARDHGRDFEKEPLGDYLLFGTNYENRWWGNAYAYISYILHERGSNGIDEAGIPTKAAYLVVEHFRGTELVDDASYEDIMAIWEWAKRFPGWQDKNGPVALIPRPSD